jgi:tetratricopeptide (TPR) repeat protein
MTDPNAIAAARQRLDRLEGFLRQDPANNALLIDAFETALSCGDWERAQFHLQHGRTLQVDPLAWRLREGDFWLAQQRYDEAQGVLEALLGASNAAPGFAAVLLHNLAFIDFKRGRYPACIERLAPLVDLGAAGAPNADAQAEVATRALQQLWLRALHHDRQLDRAMVWAQEAQRQQRLDPQAAGVASLVAIDAADFVAAQRWSAISLQEGDSREHPVEVLVTEASLALAAGNPARASQFADAALQRRPEDGRAWSARGFAALLAGDTAAAVMAFERALSTMADHIGTWHGLGWAQILAGDLPAARATFENALALDRNFAESHGGLAVVLAMQQSRQEAEAHAELALKLDKSNLSGRYAGALLKGEAKDARDVQRLARRLLGARPAPLGGRMTDLLPPEASSSFDHQEH